MLQDQWHGAGSAPRRVVESDRQECGVLLNLQHFDRQLQRLCRCETPVPAGPFVRAQQVIPQLFKNGYMRRLRQSVRVP